MPYLPHEARDELEMILRLPENAGELNYCLTRTVQEYVLAKGKSYAVLNDVLGALEGAKLEFYRRVVAPYEDKKKEENGDIY